jgi:hypothetical protein
MPFNRMKRTPLTLAGVIESGSAVWAAPIFKGKHKADIWKGAKGGEKEKHNRVVARALEVDIGRAATSINSSQRALLLYLSTVRRSVAADSESVSTTLKSEKIQFSDAMSIETKPLATRRLLCSMFSPTMPISSVISKTSVICDQYGCGDVSRCG